VQPQQQEAFGGDNAYAAEGITAEMCWAFPMCWKSTTGTWHDSAAYIDHWLKVMKADNAPLSPRPKVFPQPEKEDATPLVVGLLRWGPFMLAPSGPPRSLLQFR